MEFTTIKVMTTLALPPGLNIALALLGLVLLPVRRWLGAFLLVLALASLYVLSTPTVGRVLLQGVEEQPALALPQAAAKEAGAIVVLGGGRYSKAPEYEGDTVSSLTLVRLRYAARLHRQIGLPLLLTGGRVYDAETSEASLMKQALTDDFQVPVRWTEEISRNTAENAQYAEALLREHGIKTVLLVTHAWHMPRSVEAFRRAGLAPIPAPTAFTTDSSGDRGALEWLPNASALEDSATAIHEHVGRLWYRLRY